MNKLELKDFLQYQFLASPKFAPGGRTAAFVVSKAKEEDNRYDSNIYIYEDDQVRQLTAMNQEMSFFWEDETHLLFPAVRTEEEKKKAKEKDQTTVYYRIDIHGGEARPAFTLPLSVNRMEQIQDQWYLVLGNIDVKYPDYYAMTKEERDKVAKHYEEEADYQVIDETPFWFNGAGYVNGQRQALFLYNKEKDELRRITEARFDTESYCILQNKVYFIGSAFTCKRPLKQELYVFDYQTGEISCLYEKMEYSFMGLSKLEDKLLVYATKGERFGLNENAFIYELEKETGELKLLQAYEENTYSSVGSDCRLGGGDIKGEADGKLYFITTRRNASHIYTMDINGQMEPFYTQEGSVDALTTDPVSGRVLFVAMEGQKLQELYLAEPDGSYRQVTHLNEEILKDKYVALPQKLTIQSGGYEIDGFVLQPKDFDETKKYPAIFDIHGGPKTVYGEVFYHEMQYWANEGYFVFFCNPVGSDGRGNEFADIRGKYGTIDYDNLMDFADAVLARYPQIDPKRVGETGGSYGGFMTNWIVGHTDRFACAATQRSISNWISFHGVSDIGTYFAPDQTGGDIYGGVEKMWEHSPLKYVENVVTPLLFIHSDEDYRCPIEQGMQFYSALAAQGNLVRMCCFKGENHELSRSGKPKHRVRRLEEITNWMNKFCQR